MLLTTFTKLLVYIYDLYMISLLETLFLDFRLETTQQDLRLGVNMIKKYFFCIKNFSK